MGTSLLSLSLTATWTASGLGILTHLFPDVEMRFRKGTQMTQVTDSAPDPKLDQPGLSRCREICRAWLA